MSLHHALVDLKHKEKPYALSFSFEGFLCAVRILRGHERPAGSSFAGSVVGSMLLHSCASVKGFVVGNNSFFYVLLEHGESGFLTLSVD